MASEQKKQQQQQALKFSKVQECKNARHYAGKVSTEELERCGFWHDKDVDRWVVTPAGKRQRWTPGWEAETQAKRRHAWILELRSRPNYKTKACEHPDKEDPSLHDHETCGFHHGYDFNQANAERIVKENSARFGNAPRQPVATREYAPNSSYTVRSYDSEFPSL